MPPLAKGLVQVAFDQHEGRAPDTWFVTETKITNGQLLHHLQ